ncbi:uncharacterized protein LOC121399476 [Xenopus laevis]|uniref:Uncharacterized protein LOC121399476 n=1 Tax=Xenopus laevis TaxID=8355 RepID=A0A8J1M3C5_XENLA|nr:uncharacterized protein LOC121399476 [Xenopus laevis]
MNRTIKDKLTKATSATWTNWKSFLPAVLAEIGMTPHSVTKLSPFEIVMGRPFPTPWVKGSLVIQHTDLNLIQEEYVRNLITTLNGIYGDVSLSFPLPPQEPTHPFRPGDPVVVRQLHSYRKDGFPFGPRVTVIAITRTAVLSDASDHWIHASRVKLAPTLPTPERSKADNTEHDTTTKSVTEGPEDDLTPLPPMMIRKSTKYALWCIIGTFLFLFFPIMIILNCICYPNPHSPLGSVCYQFFKSNTRLHRHERSNPIATLGGQSTNERQVAIKQSDGTTTFWYNSVGKKS